MPGISDGSAPADPAVTLSGPDRAVADQICEVATALTAGEGALDVLIPGLVLPDPALADLAGRSGSFVLTVTPGALPGLLIGHGRVSVSYTHLSRVSRRSR